MRRKVKQGARISRSDSKFKVLVLFIVIALTLPAAHLFLTVNSRAQISGMFLTTLEYPDNQIIPFYGTLTYTGSFHGTTFAGEEGKDGYTKYNWENATTRLSITYHRQGMNYKYEGNFTGSEDMLRQCTRADGSPFYAHDIKTITSSITISGSRNLGEELSTATMGSSRRLGLANVNLGDAVNIEREEGKREAKSHIVSKNWVDNCARQETTEEDKTKFIGLNGGRIPNYGAVSNSRFATAAAAVERAGKDGVLPFIQNSGTIEVPWNGRGSAGQINLPILVKTMFLMDANWDTEPSWRAKDEDTGDGAFLPGTLTIEWTIGTAAPPEDLKLIIDADDYDNWLPQGGADEKTAGNDIAVRAVLTTRDGTEPKQKPFKIIFELVNTSSEKGVSLNFPAEAKASKDLDFKFDKANNPQLAIDDPKGQRAVSQSGETAAGAYLSSYDWGGYTTLKVSAEMRDGKIIVGHFGNENGAAEIPFPRRTGDSKIADAWKRNNNVGDKTEKDDFDKQVGNNNDGDGFTLYEEYRGVTADGKHQYLNPNKKDLIIENRLAEPAVKGGLKLFETASGINVIEMKEGELSESRIVNVNQGYARGGEQYALRLIKHKFESDKDLAEAQKGEKVRGNYPKSPKDCPEIWVNQDLAKVIASHGANVTAGIASTIAHEIAHGLGVKHHGDVDGAGLAVVREISDPNIKIYNQDGTLIPVRPYQLEGLVGTAHGMASGDIYCIMTYNHYFQWSVPLGENGRIFLAAPVDDPPQTLFCKSKNGTKWNSVQNHQPYPSPVFGDAAVGDCMSQFRVKDPPTT